MSGDTNTDNVLDVDEVWTYSHASLAAAVWQQTLRPAMR